MTGLGLINDAQASLNPCGLQMTSWRRNTLNSLINIRAHAHTCKEYVIGQKESPFPMVEIDTSINKEENDQMVKVVFIAKKSLIPCRF